MAIYYWGYGVITFLGHFVRATVLSISSPVCVCVCESICAHSITQLCPTLCDPHGL